MTWIVGRALTADVRWWGWSQWYKWRWNETHIDLGPVSVYNLHNRSWPVIAFLIVPLRLLYHARVAGDERSGK